MSQKSQNLFLHMDGDSFFCACEVVRDNTLRGKPIVVGEDRGMVVALSYEAKNLGVTRGMPIFKVRKEYKQVIVLPHHFDLYQTISQEVVRILRTYVEHVEVYSIDECFAYIKTSDIVYAGSIEKLINQIKNEIKDTCHVTYSFGVGRTKALAKTASKAQKPNGVVVLLDTETEKNVLQNTLIETIWGIGRQTAPLLYKLGIRTAYDFIHYDFSSSKEMFSKTVFELKDELSGTPRFALNDNPDPRDQKSIQSTATFRPASTDRAIIFAELSKNVELACEQARSLGLVSNTVSVFLKNVAFTYSSETIHFSVYTSDPGTILEKIDSIFTKFHHFGSLIRSTGVTLHNLIKEEDAPLDLFDKQQYEKEKSVLNSVLDTIKRKFGNNSIERASSLKSHKTQRGSTFPK